MTHRVPDSSSKTTPGPGAEPLPDDLAIHIPATPAQFAEAVGAFMARLPANAAVIATRCWWRQEAADRDRHLTLAVRAYARGQADDDSREERAAILEFDAGMPRHDANRVAKVRRRRA